MKKYATFKNVIIVILFILVLLFALVRPEPEVVTKTEEIQVEVISDEIKAELAKLPLYKDSLEQARKELKAIDGKLTIVYKDLQEAIEQIHDNSVEEDIAYFAEFYQIRDSLPMLIRLESREVVTITPSQLKNNNIALANLVSFSDENALLLEKIEVLEETLDYHIQQNNLWAEIYAKTEERFKLNQKIIADYKDDLADQEKKTRRMKWVAGGAGILGLLVGLALGG